MGMSAEIVAIGPFSEELVPILQHAAHRYEGTRAGTPVVTLIVSGVGSTSSRELAAACGIGPWDFGQHALDPAKIDIDKFGAAAQSLGAYKAVTALRELVAAGFELFFLPNG